MILDDDNIVEISSSGVVVQTVSVAGLMFRDGGISIDFISGNVLLAGGDIPKVYEMAWKLPTFGEILWEHGELTTGSATGFLNKPRYATYGTGLDSILICDQGNNRIVAIDRSTIPETEVAISSVVAGDSVLSMYRPIRCSQVGAEILVCEENGEQEFFSSNADSHPAMARSGMSTATGKDALSQYSGFKFVPILRGVK